MASVQEGQHFWCTPTLSAVRGGIKGLMSFQIMAKNDGEFTTSTCVQIVYEWGMEGARLIARGRTRTRKAPRTNTDAYTKTHTHTLKQHMHLGEALGIALHQVALQALFSFRSILLPPASTSSRSENDTRLVIWSLWLGLWAHVSVERGCSYANTCHSPPNPGQLR